MRRKKPSTIKENTKLWPEEYIGSFVEIKETLLNEKINKKDSQSQKKKRKSEYEVLDLFKLNDLFIQEQSERLKTQKSLNKYKKRIKTWGTFIKKYGKAIANEYGIHLKKGNNKDNPLSAINQNFLYLLLLEFLNPDQVTPWSDLHSLYEDPLKEIWKMTTVFREYIKFLKREEHLSGDQIKNLKKQIKLLRSKKKAVEQGSHVSQASTNNSAPKSTQAKDMPEQNILGAEKREISTNEFDSPIAPGTMRDLLKNAPQADALIEVLEKLPDNKKREILEDPTVLLRDPDRYLTPQDGEEQKSYNYTKPQEQIRSLTSEEKKSWKTLFSLALEFRELSPWTYLFDNQVIGILNPISGEMGFSSIMGNLGEHFALFYYENEKALNGMLALEHDRQDVPGFMPPDNMLTFFLLQKGLMLSFEDKKNLRPHETELYDVLDIWADVKNYSKEDEIMFGEIYPVFQVYDPLYFPWFPTQDQVKEFIYILQQTLHVLKRVVNQGLKIPRINGIYGKEEVFARTYLQHSIKHSMKNEKHLKGKDLTWKDTTVSYEGDFSDHIFRPLYKKKLKQLIERPNWRKTAESVKKAYNLSDFKPNNSKTWAFELCIHNSFIQQENERPFNPFSYFCLDPETDIILSVGILTQKDPIKKMYTDLGNLISQRVQIPGTLQCINHTTYQILKPFTDTGGITLEEIDDIPTLRYMLEELQTFQTQDAMIFFKEDN